MVLTDGSSLDVSPSTLSHVRLVPGCTLQGDEIRALRDDAEARQAEERALGLLSKARHTRQALRRKLERRGYAAAAVERALGRLAELGYVNDEAAAEGWLQHRIERHPEGRAALLIGLLRHGVPREIAERAVEAHLPAATEAEVARRYLRKLYPGADARERLLSEPERSRALRKLLSRGFSRPAARRALPESGDEREGEG